MPRRYTVAMPAYRTAPFAARRLPPGTPYIIANEGAERFSFYGMRAVLVVFMTRHLLDASGAPDLMNDEQAKGWYHLFVSPAGMGFVREALSRTGAAVIGRLALIYLFVAVFWALFDQTGSAWVLQAQQMDRVLFGMEILPAQIQAANPLLVMLLIPLFAYVIYPALHRIWRLTELRKIGVGLFLTVLAFAIPTWVQQQIDLGATPSIAWQLLAYLVLTSAEVMVSITCLEFSYTQAPRTMKSFVMAFFMLSIAAGNLFTSAVNFFIHNADGSSSLGGADYYLFFTLTMLITAVVFVLVARVYKGDTYLHEEIPEAAAGSES